MFKFDKEAGLQEICPNIAQKKKKIENSDIKTFKMPKNIKESKDALSRDY